MLTYQHYTIRYFGGGTMPQRRAAVEAFAQGVEAQAGLCVVIFQNRDGEFGVDMAGWPDGEMFGPWFEETMTQHGVEIHD